MIMDMCILSHKTQSFLLLGHVVDVGAGKLRCFTVTIPPIKTVMTGGWFLAVFYRHYWWYNGGFPATFGCGFHISIIDAEPTPFLFLGLHMDLWLEYPGGSCKRVPMAERFDLFRGENEGWSSENGWTSCHQVPSRGDIYGNQWECIWSWSIYVCDNHVLYIYNPPTQNLKPSDVRQLCYHVKSARNPLKSCFFSWFNHHFLRFPADLLRFSWGWSAWTRPFATSMQTRPGPSVFLRLFAAAKWGEYHMGIQGGITIQLYQLWLKVPRVAGSISIH